MSAIAPHLPGARVLDLFAGSGALGLEALSRGASHATFVENGAAAVRILKQNIEDLGVSPEVAEIRTVDAIRFVETLSPLAYDVAFADPPYERGFAAHLARRFAEHPFAEILCIEHGRGEPLPTGVVARERRYGDTVLTFLTAEDES
jgi:16S rRNA (guanine966-N2)-methyltransferase